MKKAIIVHGWDGTPEDGWFPWLTKELESHGFEVAAPRLPDTETPRIEKWVPALAEAAGKVDEATYFIGHSMGCQTIARYLEGLEAGSRVGGAVYVAGFFDSLTLGEDEEESVWRAWKDTPVNLDHVLARCPKSIAIFSDDDPYVPLSNQDDFRDKLGSEIIVQHAMSHFSRRPELPVALESVLKLAQA